MKLRLNDDKTLAGPTGVVLGGQLFEVDEEEGFALLTGGYATSIEGVEQHIKPEPKELEIAELQAGDETAQVIRKRGRPKA